MGVTASIFDVANKGASVTLSGSNLVATVSSGTGSVRGTNKISGLTYFEMVIGATLSGSSRVGVCNPAQDFTTLLGVNANGVGYNADGTVKINNSNVATIATYTTNNNIGVAIDPVNKLIWFRVNGGNWNNDVIGNQNPVGAVGGISFSSVGANFSPAWGGSATASATAKFASGSWTYTAPTGYGDADTMQTAGVNGDVADRASSITQYGPAIVSTPASFGVVASPSGPRDTTLQDAYYKGTSPYSPAGSPTYVAGVVKEAGVAVSGKTVNLYDAETGVLLGSDVSDGSGLFSIHALGRTNVYAVALDPAYQAQVFDQLTPV